MFVMPALVVYIRGPDLPAVALSLVAARLLVCGLALFQLRQYLRRSVPIRSDDIKPLLNFGVWVTISGFLSPLMVYGDRFFVSAVVGAQELSLYVIPLLASWSTIGRLPACLWVMLVVPFWALFLRCWR